MEFNATSLNVTELLVVALAVVAILMVLRKRYTSNLPLLFYFALIMFSNMTDREVNPYLLYAGLLLAMFLRFEFMGGPFVKLVAFMTSASLVVIAYLMVSEVFAA
jgi:hypothetical protein